MSDVPRAAEFRCDVPTVERLAELAKAPLPLGLVLRSQDRAFMRDVYLDTADNALAVRNIVCRVRYGADDRRTLTVSLAQPGVPGAGPSEVFDAEVAAIDLPRSWRATPTRRAGSAASWISHGSSLGSSWRSIASSASPLGPGTCRAGSRFCTTV